MNEISENSTPIQWFHHWYMNSPEIVYLRQPIDGIWHDFTIKEVYLQATRIVYALRKLGLNEGDSVAILSKNCAHWIITDIALQLGNFVSVPLYIDQTQEQLNYILNDAKCKAIFVGKMDAETWQRYHTCLPQNIFCIQFPFMGQQGDCDKHDFTGSWLYWDDLQVSSPETTQLQSPQTPTSQWIWTILYTSGTSGIPKGVAHSYAGITSIRSTLQQSFQFSSHDQFFSYLPLAHAAERMLLQLCSQFFCVPIAFTESLQSFQHDLKTVQPSLFFSVPRIWKKLQLGILNKVPQAKLNIILKVPLVNSLIRRKLKRELGLSNARIIMSGAAPIALEVLRWFDSIGVRILEGYGLTENFAFGCLNTHDEYRLGSIGKPLPGSGFRLSDEQEIQFSGSMLMREYHQQPELTKDAFTHDGYFKTGDRAEVDTDGFVFIKGRVKDIFKTAKGEYVVPLLIENKLMSMDVFEHVCVIGSGLPQPIAVVTCPTLTQSESAHAQLQQALHELNNTLLKHEKLAKFLVFAEDWTVENGLMTPTLKVKRYALEELLYGTFADTLKDRQPVVFLPPIPKH